MKRFCLSLVVVVSLVAPPRTFSYSRAYDDAFRGATRRNFGHLVSPNWLKAVAVAESALKYNARSYVGAQGLMQFMPGTWSGIAPEPWKSLGPLNPEAAIYVGALYLRQIWDKYPLAMVCDRKAFSNAGYNSGPGNVNRARARCALDARCNKEMWDAPNVENFLVTAPQFQKETRDYVKRIRKYEDQIARTEGL